MSAPDLPFPDWHRALKQLARERGGSAADADAWYSEWELGKTPEQAWADAWGDE